MNYDFTLMILSSFSEKKLMLLFVGHLLFDAINYSTLFIFVYSFFIF
ncbi:hypothetical protein HMP0721_1823 [Pseudoramibacter alactolyticus ATCC 23263]|uniref:Uncharacterized protein n=1 Tax=Pseudoramibacter alactolyticus ATCC 23263 TaxID=887929 RepID=E6MII8_9FIRM|nr:hypothetical protein HMP0721_1823 [Pseudoramibacter alactolyticus ATCC 23263]